MDNILSDKETVRSGVPQGSILGPILFIVFTADFPEYIAEHKTVAYADDTQILVTADNQEELITKVENCIAKAQTWYSNNSLKI